MNFKLSLRLKNYTWASQLIYHCIRGAMRTIKFIILLLLLASPMHSSYAKTAENIPLNIANTHKTLNDFKGKLVYLDFWASWCVPCRNSFPFMNQMLSKYQNKGLEIIAVNLDKDISQVRKFLAKYSANFKISYDSTGETAEKFNVRAMPTSFLISRNGEIIATHAGFRQKDADKIEQLILSNL